MLNTLYIVVQKIARLSFRSRFWARAKMKVLIIIINKLKKDDSWNIQVYLLWPINFSIRSWFAPEGDAFTLLNEYMIGRLDSDVVDLGVVSDQQIVLYFNLRIWGDFAVVVRRVAVIKIVYDQAVVAGPNDPLVLNESGEVQE